MLEQRIVSTGIPLTFSILVGKRREGAVRSATEIGKGNGVDILSMGSAIHDLLYYRPLFSGRCARGGLAESLAAKEAGMNIAPCKQCGKHQTQNGQVCAFCAPKSPQPKRLEDYEPGVTREEFHAILRKASQPIIKPAPLRDDLLTKWLAQSLKDFEAMYSDENTTYNAIEAELEFIRKFPHRLQEFAPKLAKARHPAALWCSQLAMFLEEFFVMAEKAQDKEDAEWDTAHPQQLQ